MISIRKTNVLGQEVDIPLSINIDDATLEAVDSFTYLGSTTPSNMSLDSDISTRIAEAAAVMSRFSNRIWTNSKLTENTKLCLPGMRPHHPSPRQHRLYFMDNICKSGKEIEQLLTLPSITYITLICYGIDGKQTLHLIKHTNNQVCPNSNIVRSMF